MVINSGGNLSVGYFKAYIGLVMASRVNTLDEARELVFSRLFNNDEKHLGAISFENFTLAYTEMKHITTL